MKKNYHHGDLHQQLISEAAKIIQAEGEAGLSMRKLATQVGVSRTAPYHHFKDKHELLCAIAEEGFCRFNELRQPLYTMANPVSEEGLQLVVKGYVQFATQFPEYYDLMFGGHIWKSDRLTASLRAQAYQSFRAEVDRARQWQVDGLIDDSIDVLRYAQVSWSTMHGMSRLLIDGIYVDQTAIESMCDTAVQMFLTFLKNNQASN
jgi:AcrR family transcriptional regulator